MKSVKYNYKATYTVYSTYNNINVSENKAIMVYFELFVSVQKFFCTFYNQDTG